MANGFSGNSSDPLTRASKHPEAPLFQGGSRGEKYFEKNKKKTCFLQQRGLN